MGTLTVSNFSHIDHHENVFGQISTAVTQVGEPPMRDLRNALQKHPCIWRTLARVCKQKHNGKENDVLWCLLASLALKQYSYRNKLIKYNSKPQLILLHSCFHGVGGSFPMFVSHPNYTKDEINDVAYLHGLEVLFPFQKHYTESDSSSSKRVLWRRLCSEMRLHASGSYLQVLQNSPLSPSSGYLEDI
jgi:hypothetical protein